MIWFYRPWSVRMDTMHYASGRNNRAEGNFVQINLEFHGDPCVLHCKLMSQPSITNDMPIVGSYWLDDDDDELTRISRNKMPEIE